MKFLSSGFIKQSKLSKDALGENLSRSRKASVTSKANPSP